MIATYRYAVVSRQGAPQNMHQSPRTRRLHNDLIALERLRSESSIFRFTAVGDPPQHYQIWFQGKSLWRDRSKVKVLEAHRVEIKLGASYPRTHPDLRWLTPIFHPNISEIGMVCLGGYGTHWVPSVQLDDLCVMLWDMARYHNLDVRSPYNREAALWVAGQSTYRFPIDDRPLRDLRAALGRAALSGEQAAGAGSPRRDIKKPLHLPPPQAPSNGTTPVIRVLNFIDRYRRVFGNGIGSEASRGNGTGEPRRSREFEHLRQILDRSTASDAPRVLAPAPDCTVSDPQPEPLNHSPDREVAELANTIQSEIAVDRDELIILDESDNDQRPVRVALAGEDILFIE
jgi:ubiquitin-protein ligase